MSSRQGSIPIYFAGVEPEPSFEWSYGLVADGSEQYVAKNRLSTYFRSSLMLGTTGFLTANQGLWVEIRILLYQSTRNQTVSMRDWLEHILSRLGRGIQGRVVSMLILGAFGVCGVNPSAQAREPGPGERQLAKRPMLTLDRVLEGPGLETRGIEASSQSVGKPFRGRLEAGLKLPGKGDGFYCKSRHVYGTQETVDALMRGFSELSNLYPGSASVVVGDISRKGGGRLSPHKSHQTGRDVDIGYFLVKNKATKRFVEVNKKTIDAEKSWALMEALIRQGRVQYIFVDHSIQPVLRAAAARAGWEEAALNILFQYPRNRSHRSGIIRHTPGHRNHMHVRFSCPASHRQCQE